MAIQVLQTPLFTPQKKKLRKKQIKELDKAIKVVIENPKIGEGKNGNLGSNAILCI
ncbi:MAG: type II toxin-antitoxin system RelE/ParE family toxin [Candidatus Anammoxibacter sp.]